MNKQKKLVIRVNYDSSDKLLTDEKLNLKMTEEWNIKRIVIALLIVIFFIATGLYYAFYKSGFPVINTSVPNSIIHEHSKNVDPQIIDSKEMGREVVSEQLIANENEIDQDNIKPVDVTDEKAEDDFVDVKPIHYSSQVVRSQLTNRVIDNEPIDIVSTPILVEKDNIRRLYYFTELKDMSGKTIYHNWTYKGEPIFRKKFDINGNRWRVATLKKLNTTLLGDWKVTLTDSKGHLLHEIIFEVIN